MKVNTVNQIPNSLTDQAVCESILDMENWQIDPKAQYFGLCVNETIGGIEFNQSMMRKIINRIKAENPEMIIAADMCSNLGSQDLSREGLWDDLGIIYSSSSKNFGTSGFCFTLIRDDVLDRVKSNNAHSKLPIPVNMDWVS